MADANNKTRSMLTLYKLKPSAAVLVVHKVLELLIAHGAAQELIKRGELTVKMLHTAMSKNFNWSQRKLGKAATKTKAGKTDAALDRAVSNLLKLLQIYADMPSSDPRHDMAVAIIDDLFPEGVFGITSARYEEELGKVRMLLEHIETNYPTEIDALGLRPHLDRLAAVADEFADALAYLDASPLTYDEVLAANEEADEAYHKFIFAVVAAFLDDDAKRAAIMKPIFNQNEWTGQYFKRRGTSPEVDPTTGEPIDDDVPPAPPEDFDLGDLDDDATPTPAEDADTDGGEQPAADDSENPVNDPAAE